MASLQLSSYNRMRYYLGSEGSELTTSVGLEMELTNWISSTSSQIEVYLNRQLKYQSYTEYYETRGYKTKYFVENPPITSITSFKEHSQGLFDGDETTLSSDEYYIGKDSAAIVLVDSLRFESPRGAKAVYVGGLAVHGTQSVFAITGSSGTWTVNNYVYGGTSGAFGILRAATASALTIENLYGVFAVDETLTEYTDDSRSVSGDASATLGSITSQSLAELYPDIVRACEIQVRFMRKHKNDYELTGSSRDGTDRRRQEVPIPEFTLQPEALNLLRPYRRLTMV